MFICDSHFSSRIMTAENNVSFMHCCNIETKEFRNVFVSTLGEGGGGRNKMGRYPSQCAPIWSQPLPQLLSISVFSDIQLLCLKFTPT
jgi:hypothetical protein